PTDRAPRAGPETTALQPRWRAVSLIHQLGRVSDSADTALPLLASALMVERRFGSPAQCLGVPLSCARSKPDAGRARLAALGRGERSDTVQRRPAENQALVRADHLVALTAARVRRRFIVVAPACRKIAVGYHVHELRCD